jgi:hypothetical protein
VKWEIRQSPAVEEMIVYSAVAGTGKELFLFRLEWHPVLRAVNGTVIIPERVHDFVEGKVQTHYDPAVVIPLRANQANTIFFAGGHETPEIERPAGWGKSLE